MKNLTRTQQNANQKAELEKLNFIYLTLVQTN